MKIKIDRKNLVRNLKILQSLSAQAPRSEERFKDVVSLMTIESGLMLVAGFGYAIMSVTIPCEVLQEGECNLNYKLLDLVKVARDDVITLTKNKNLSVSGESGFKATLNDREGISFPIKRVLEVIATGVGKTLDFRSDELKNLIDVSFIFDSIGIWKWVEITSTGTEVNAVVQGSEEGVLENFPMEATGDEAVLRMRPEHLKPLLSFAGEHVRLQQLKENVGFLLITDPENDSWFATITQVGRSMNEAYTGK